MIDPEKVRQSIADKIERYLAPSFRACMKLNLIAVHPDNRDANILVGQSSLEEIRAALATLEPAPPAGIDLGGEWRITGQPTADGHHRICVWWRGQLVCERYRQVAPETEAELALEGQRALASHVDALVRMWRLGRDL